MTLDVFWQRIEEAMNGECDECPVYQYAAETNTERMCDKVCDCADGLMMLHKKLQIYRYDGVLFFRKGGDFRWQRK